MSSSSASRAPARPLPTHVAVEVSRDVIRAGSASRRFREGDARSLLTAYLTLIRGLRDQRRARTIELRSADIEALATYLGRPGSEVVERLAEMMGATRTQRATMLTLFGAGALVIGLAGSTAVGRAQSGPTSSLPPGAAVEAVAPQAAPALQLPVTIHASTASNAPAPTTTAAPATTPPTTPLETSAPLSSATEPPTILDPPSASEAPQPPSTRVAASDPPEAAVPEPEVAPEPEATEPPAEATPEPAPDDTVVTDIGTPPIPPSTEPASDDTVVTDIGTPPIPPTTEPSADDTVITDIGTPPIPPTTGPPAG
jgi:hypothetical protein